MDPAVDANAAIRRGFGPPGSTGSAHMLAISDVAIKISGIELTLQVDDGGEHSFVLFGDLYDTKRQRMPLVNISEIDGNPSVAPLRVPFSAERIAVDLVDGSGNTSPELSCVFDFENDVFLAPEEISQFPLGAAVPGGIGTPAPKKREKPTMPGWGPVGLHTYPRAVTIISLESRDSGEQDLRLAVDDGGHSLVLRLTIGSRPPFDVQLTRSEGGPNSPGLAWLVLPAGTDCLGFQFIDAAGMELPQLTCRFLVRSSTFLPPGPCVVTDERSLRAHPLLNEILDSEPDAACGPPGTFVYQFILNVTGIRPAEGGMRLIFLVDDGCEAAQVRWSTDAGTQPATVPLYRLPLYGEAGPGFAELLVPPEATVIYFELFDAQGQPLDELTSSFVMAERRISLVNQQKAHKKVGTMGPRGMTFTELPLDYKLLNTPTFGPQGMLGHPHILTILSAQRSGSEPLRVSLLLDDGGRHTRVCWWNELLEYEQEVTILRATPSSAVVVELSIPRPTTKLYLDFADAYDRSSEDVSCIFYVEDGTLGPQHDEARSPATEKYPIRDRLLNEKVLCASCRKATYKRDATHISDLPDDEGKILRRDYQIDWDHCHLCRDCRPAIYRRVGLFGRLTDTFHRGSFLFTLIILFFKAYIGSLFVCMLPGQYITELLQMEPFFFGPGGATFASATFWAVFVCVLPLFRTWNFIAAAVDYLTGIDLLRHLVVWVFVPAFSVMAFMEMATSFAPPHGFPKGEHLLLWDFFFYAAFSGMSASLGLLALIGRASTTGMRYHEYWVARLERATRIMRSMHRLIRAQRKDELHDLLKELFLEHMAVSSYIYLEVGQDKETWHPTRTVGCSFDDVKEWRFRAGDPGLAGQGALFGSIFDRTSYEKALDGQQYIDGPVPIEVVIPARVDGVTTAMVAISKFRRARYDEEMQAFCSTLSVVFSAGLTNIDTLSKKDSELRDAREEIMVAQAKADFLKEAFSKTVAPSVVEQIMQEPDKFATGGERRLLSVFYSDIRSFTALSERVSAEEMVALLNEYFEAMARVVFKHEGTIDKWIGDAVMVFFGAPHSQPDHARRAIQMSIEMMSTLATLNQRWLAQKRFARMGVPDYPGLAIGIGIHSGEANVGFLGAKSSRVDYTVIGDTVNTAARLVGQAGAGEILISRATVDMAGIGFKVTECEPMQLKGKTELVQVYSVDY